MTERQHATWGELLREAVEKPGRMLQAYTAFHNYSFGNALLALEQRIRRNLQPGPLNTYQGWLERKRQVRKGEKGITLACLCRSREPPRPTVSRRKQPNRKLITLSGFGRIGLCSRKPRGKIRPFHRFPALTSTRHFAP
jgi:hypothetical protein